MNTVTVITADVIGSRQAREQVTRLIDFLTGLDHPLFLAGFSVSRGDELQGVCKGILEAAELIRCLRLACIPLKLKVGIGIGFLDTGADSADPWKMNGSAFAEARKSLDSIKKVRQPRTVVGSEDSKIATILR